MTASRRLVVNADDLGATEGVNAGIAEAHLHGIVTSASLMVRGEAAGAAARLRAELPGLSVGLHIDLGEWAYLDGEWRCIDHVVDAEDAHAVAEEVERQLATFVRLAGTPPTHLDSHQHAHLSEPATSIVDALGARLRVPVRRRRADIAYRGEFYGQSSRGEPAHEAIGVPALLTLLAGLDPGVSELCCHPGRAAGLRSVYRAEREIELRTLCDPRVRDTLSQQCIVLWSFADLPLAGP